MNNVILKKLIDEKDYKQLYNFFLDLNAIDIAELFSDINKKERIMVFRMLSKEKAAEVFAYLQNDIKQSFVSSFTDEEMLSIIENMFTDDVVDFLEDMPANFVKSLLSKVSTETRNKINHILNYPVNSSGSIMTVEYISLNQHMKVSEALSVIRKYGEKCETVYTCYVTDKHKLIGTVSARKLLTSNKETKISEIMKENFISVNACDDKEVAANLFRKYGLLAIPVLDSEDYIVGIITFDDAIDVLTTESTEDIHKMAAINPDEESYLSTPVYKHAKNRITWLLVLMISSTITGFIISNYEDAFTIMPILVSFIPMLMDTGGNCGSQSSTVIIRGLALQEFDITDFLKIIWKEFRISIAVSIILSIINGVRIAVFNGDITLAISVSLSLMLTVIIAKTVGCLLPLFAKKINADPAIMAAPLITTIVDTLSIVVYFKICSVMFGF